MKRLVLVIIAALLTSGSLVNRPSGACPLPTCSASDCNASCLARGYYGGICNVCRTSCLCEV